MSNKSVAIVFSGPDIRLDFGQTVDGFKGTVQGALVNLLTDSGSDAIFPDRGTGLFVSALRGGIYNQRSAAHAANFASSDTLFFSRAFERGNANDHLAEVTLVPEELRIGSLSLRAGFVSSDGVVLSYPNLNIQP